LDVHLQEEKRSTLPVPELVSRRWKDEEQGKLHNHIENAPTSPKVDRGESRASPVLFYLKFGRNDHGTSMVVTNLPVSVDPIRSEAYNSFWIGTSVALNPSYHAE